MHFGLKEVNEALILIIHSLFISHPNLKGMIVLKTICTLVF